MHLIHEDMMLLNEANKMSSALSTLAQDSMHISFSQFGEDIAAMHILQVQQRLVKGGFYVDIGALNPWAKSNTALLHKFYDWSGINVDPNPETIEAFNQERPNDINLMAAVSDKVEEKNYVMFNRPGVNTISSEVAEAQANAAHGAYEIIGERKVTTTTLEAILDQHVPEGTEVDLLDVDVEGLDLEVLQSNNWTKYRPLLVLAETHGIGDLGDNNSHPTCEYLKQQDYRWFSKIGPTSIFLRNKTA